MILNLDKIKWRNFKIWFIDQVKRKRVITNFFITRNAWGAFSINSHINQHTGQPKVTYNTVETARKSAEKMGEKHNTHFSYYKCLFCDGYHIGKNKDNHDCKKWILYSRMFFSNMHSLFNSCRLCIS